MEPLSKTTAYTNVQAYSGVLRGVEINMIYIEEIRTGTFVVCGQK